MASLDVPLERPRRSAFRRILRANWITTIAAFYLAAVVLLSAFAPLVTVHSPTQTKVVNRLKPPSVQHWLGTDNVGRDIYARLVYGGRVSLSIGLLSTVIGMTAGVLYGLVSGYAGGWVDHLLMRVADVLIAFPGILISLVFLAALGPSFATLTFTIALGIFPRFGRIVRGQVLSLKQQDYVEAARAAGGAPWRIMLRHLLPNLVGPVIVLSTLYLAGAVLAEATISYLGLGIKPPTPSWGLLVSEGRDWLQRAPWISVSAGVVITLTTLAFNIIGDTVRDYLDPRTRGQVGRSGA